jgi:hypothetical protein
MKRIEKSLFAGMGVLWLSLGVLTAAAILLDRSRLSYALGLMIALAGIAAALWFTRGRRQRGRWVMTLAASAFLAQYAWRALTSIHKFDLLVGTEWSLWQRLVLLGEYVPALFLLFDRFVMPAAATLYLAWMLTSALIDRHPR